MKTAFAVLLACVVSTAAIAQDSADSRATQERPYRDPHKALVLGSIFPGAGYAYTGEYLRGYGTYLVTAGSIAFGSLIYEMDSCGLNFICTSHKVSGENRAVGILLIGAGLWTWISAARDAPKSAERANERHRRRELNAHPLVEVNPQPGPQLRAGLSLGW